MAAASSFIRKLSPPSMLRISRRSSSPRRFGARGCCSRHQPVITQAEHVQLADPARAQRLRLATVATGAWTSTDQDLQPADDPYQAPAPTAPAVPVAQRPARRADDLPATRASVPSSPLASGLARLAEDPHRCQHRRVSAWLSGVIRPFLPSSTPPLKHAAFPCRPRASGFGEAR